MNQIILRNNSNGWVAQYVGPHADSIIRLFGCATIPTAFTSYAQSDLVKAEIEKLNPGITVLVHSAIVLP